MSDHRCEGMQILLRRLAPGTPVSIWFDSSGFITTFIQFVRHDLAAFSGGALDGGLTYVVICSIHAVKVTVDMTGAAPAPQALDAPEAHGGTLPQTPGEDGG